MFSRRNSHVGNGRSAACSRESYAKAQVIDHKQLIGTFGTALISTHPQSTSRCWPKKLLQTLGTGSRTCWNWQTWRVFPN